MLERALQTGAGSPVKCVVFHCVSSRCSPVRAATERERISFAKPNCFLTGAALKEVSPIHSTVKNGGFERGLPRNIRIYSIFVSAHVILVAVFGILGDCYAPAYEQAIS